MTEKRFEELGDTHIIDNETGKKIYAPCEYELIALLNQLYEENEQLKSENQMLRTTIARNEVHIKQIKHQGEWR